MDTLSLKDKFARMGARLEIAEVRNVGRDAGQVLAVDIRKDHKGEYFDVQVKSGCLLDMDAVDVRPDMRHLLLMARTRDVNVTAGRRWPRPAIPTKVDVLDKQRKSKFLCGHDERSWFVAAVPEDSGASNVRTAMEALKPFEVRSAQVRAGVRFDKRNRRKNAAFVRQGEWFFLPRPDLVVSPTLIRRREPLQRSGGKPHTAEFAYRTGGTRVWVSREFPSGLTDEKYAEYIKIHAFAKPTFRMMLRNAGVFVKGRVSHSDHATIKLACWHQVIMNTEHLSRARANVVFLD